MVMIEPRHPNAQREFAASRRSNFGRRREKVLKGVLSPRRDVNDKPKVTSSYLPTVRSAAEALCLARSCTDSESQMRTV
jgi:hypothetical protein